MRVVPARSVLMARPLLPLAGLVAASLLLGTAALGYVRATPRPHPRSAAAASAPVCGPAQLLFETPESGMERAFVATLPKDKLREVSIRSLASAEARALGVRESPTLVAVNEAGRETGRWAGADEIQKGLRKIFPAGATCRAPGMPRLRWIDDRDPRARRVYRHFPKGEVPDIYKALSLRPELMDQVQSLCDREHFEDGYLSRRTKERIATLVSSLNQSTYCKSSHSEGLRDLGASRDEVAALLKGDPEGTALPRKEKALLQFTRHLTLKPGEISDDDIARLRGAGWRDEQIYEAAFDASLFSFFNRMAATYGLDEAPDRDRP